jgi:hypothetical protein
MSDRDITGRLPRPSVHDAMEAYRLPTLSEMLATIDMRQVDLVELQRLNAALIVAYGVDILGRDAPLSGPS